MRRFVLCGWMIAAVVASASNGSIAGDETSGAPRVVGLTSRETSRLEQAEMPPTLLLREVARQAFLIAARDECGLATRDATLREAVPTVESPQALSFELYSAYVKSKKNYDVQYVLSRLKNGGNEEVWRQAFPADINNPERTVRLTTAAEELSRTVFKDLLKQAENVKTVPAGRASAEVPAEARRSLWEWNEIAVFGAVRRIHAEIREKGESPELLGGLSIGYANLASLTEYYYSPAHKAFCARALLYAERLVHQYGGSSLSLWHRAYVRALVGLHNQAERDVDAARALEAGRPAPSLPFWTEIIESFSHGKMAQMLERGKSVEGRRLARYLNFQAVTYEYLTDATIKVASPVVEEVPDCFRALDAMCDSQKIGILQAITWRAFPLLSKCLHERLGAVYGFPAALGKKLSDRKPLNADAGLDEKAIEDEIGYRTQLVADLNDETAAGRDQSEPSLAVLGQIIQEIEFKGVIRRLELEGTVWAVQTEPTILTYHPLCEHHRYAAYLDVFSTAKEDKEKAARELFEKIDPTELSSTEAGLVIRIYHLDKVRGARFHTIAAWHLDPVFPDEMIGLWMGMGGKPDARPINHDYMKMIWRTSSRIPVAYAIQIRRHWSQAEEFAGAAEKQFADDSNVLNALVERYLSLKRFDDAERCARQRVKAVPDYSGYEMLAGIYKQKGDMARWKETLEKSLELPEMGLEHASVQDKIARYHMDRKEWKDAVIYADRAAESYSEWSMETAAQCHEKLGEWKRAEAFWRAISERYANSSMKWLLWCQRVGHGDAEAAAACARAHFESLGTSIYWDTKEQIAFFYLLTNEPEKSLVVFSQTFKESKTVYDAMHAAIAADNAKKPAERDEWFAKIKKADPKANPAEPRTALYQQFVDQLQKSLPPGSVSDLDFKKIDGIISESAKVDSTANLEYFVGMFLKNRGDATRAQAYLIRAAQSPHIYKLNHVLACQTLRQMKVAVPTVPENDKPKQ
jgi:tetratricopeptide (TPR) repeat protein